MNEGNDADADAMLGRKKKRPNWLVGRQGRTTTSTETLAAQAASVASVPDTYVEELTAKITQNLESEMEAKVNIKVQQNMALFVKKLQEANPEIKLDFSNFCATVSSDADENRTPVTPCNQGGASS